MTDDSDRDNRLGAIFPAERVDARFVLAMGMANNDIQTALWDVIKADRDEAPDWSYRIRVLTGHLVEALDSLNAYSSRHAEVGELIDRVPEPYTLSLKVVRGTLQKAGSKALQHMRDSTFHYPSPKSNYSPTSDERLEETMRLMADHPTHLTIDGDTQMVTLTFASEVALALAISEHKPDPKDHAKQFKAARDGALAFRVWSQSLTMTYLESVGASLGAPILVPKPHPPTGPT
jgi:hypothetical protein